MVGVVMRINMKASARVVKGERNGQRGKGKVGVITKVMVRVKTRVSVSGVS